MPENILLITVDSLRFDHCPLPGEGTPAIGALQADAATFEHAFATGPGTTCSFPGILTGTLPLSYGGLGPLTPDRPRLAEYLHEAGFATGGFQTNPFLSEHFNYDRGFDEFEDYQNPLMGVATDLFPRGVEVNHPKLRKLDDMVNFTGVIKRLYQSIVGKPRPYVSAEVITDDAINWLQETDGPFFCWTHYMDVHHPCFPPESFRREFDVSDVSVSQISDWYSTLLDEPEILTDRQRIKCKRLYEAAIAYTDTQIGRLIEYLKTADRWEETMVIVTSDHGELFGEYGRYGKPIRMYDELLRVPLFVSNGPSYLEAATEELVSLLDLPPLIHDAMNLEVPVAYQGRIPTQDSERRSVIAEHHVDGEVVIGARSKTHLYEYNGLENDRSAYEVGSSTYTPINSGEHEVTHLREIVQNRIETIDLAVDVHDLDKDIEDRLEDLGYL